MRPPGVTLALCLALLSGTAQAQDCLPLTPRDPEGAHVIPGTLGGVVYRVVDGQPLALDAYAPRGDASRPLVVVVHGGAGTTGSRVAFVGQFLETLTDAGYAWASIDYRLRVPVETQADDVGAALAFLRCHATALRIDVARTVLLGEDHGALIARAVSTRTAVAGVISIGGVLTAGLKPGATDREPGATSREPVAGKATSRDVPQLMIHGTDDREVPIAEVERACMEARTWGAGCALVPVAGASHRAENWWPRQWGYKGRLIDWLEGRVGVPPPHRPHETSLQKRLVYDAAERLHADLWVPPGPGPHPLVLLAHGGGWEAGDRVTYLTPLIAPLARAGFAWMSIDYRLTPQVPHAAQLDDLRRAIAWARRQGRARRIDPTRIVILGESASGQMVMQVATTDRGLRGVVSFYGVYDFAQMVTDASPRSLLARLFGRRLLDDEARAELRRFSPLHQVRTGMPPVLLVNGTNERLWDQGVAMAAALERARVPHRLVRLEGAPHGMENWEGHPEWTGYKDILVQWLRARFARASPSSRCLLRYEPDAAPRRVFGLAVAQRWLVERREHNPLFRLRCATSVWGVVWPTPFEQMPLDAGPGWLDKVGDD